MSRTLLAIVLLALMTAAQAGEFSQTLNAQLWAQPRDGDTVRRFAPLRRVVAALQEDATARLLIRYPGGEEGTLWAHELRGWLVSLGVESRRIDMIPGGVAARSVLLTVRGEQVRADQPPLVVPETEPAANPATAHLTERRE
ncbi:MAG TPA: hypothetical protein ENJ01_05745 [Gammaproteobacteria bacterium]|nr:hypothetical protein [Gammaproteobacteria bacterium]